MPRPTIYNVPDDPYEKANKGKKSTRPILFPNSILHFGKYKGQTIEQVLTQDKDYIQYLIKQHAFLLQDHNNNILFPQAKVLQLNHKLHTGKYKGKRLKYVMKLDKEYVEWCIRNDYIRIMYMDE